MGREGGKGRWGQITNHLAQRFLHLPRERVAVNVYSCVPCKNTKNILPSWKNDKVFSFTVTTEGHKTRNISRCIFSWAAITAPRTRLWSSLTRVMGLNVPSYVLYQIKYPLYIITSASAGCRSGNDQWIKVFTKRHLSVSLMQLF